MKSVKFEKVKVNTKADIITALSKFMPDSKSVLRKTLLDGFNIVKNRVEFNSKIDSKLDVDKMRFWVDTMVDERLGGRREGLLIVWSVDNKKITFNPWSGEMKEQESKGAD